MTQRMTEKSKENWSINDLQTNGQETKSTPGKPEGPTKNYNDYLLLIWTMIIHFINVSTQIYKILKSTSRWEEEI